MVHIKLNRGIFSLELCNNDNNNNRHIHVLYSSRVKYIITGNPVVYIKTLDKTKNKKTKNPTDPTNY